MSSFDIAIAGEINLDLILYGLPEQMPTERELLARYLREAGQIREDLAGRLPPQRYPRRGESAPHPWTAKDVRLVLDQIDRQSAIGKRDYAMILLTARLGLRVGDLRRLELGWFDWRARNLALTQHKTGLPFDEELIGIFAQPEFLKKNPTAKQMR